MADTARLTVHLPKEDLQRLEALAQARGESTAVLAVEAVAAYLAVQEWQVDQVRQAVARADAGGQFVEHEAVAAWLRSWGTENELPRPR